MPSNIVISYRRSDSADVASRIYDRLVERCGRRHVFKDVNSIPPGVDFRQHLADVLSNCQAMVVVVGRSWAGVTDDGGRRRLDDPDDFVRLEVETALKRHVRVVPVLVNGATLPTAAQLPASLESLTFHQAIEVRPDPDFHSDVDRLLATLRPRKPYVLIAAAIAAAAVLIAASALAFRLTRSEPIEKTAYKLRDDLKEAVKAVAESKPPNIALLDAEVTTLKRDDPHSGHTLYFAGEVARFEAHDKFDPNTRCPLALPKDHGVSLEPYDKDFREYLDIAVRRNATSARQDHTVCYDNNPDGFCVQRDAWVNHLMANDLYQEALAAGDPETRDRLFGEAMPFVKAALQYREKPETPPGFTQCTPTVELQRRITTRLAAEGTK